MGVHREWPSGAGGGHQDRGGCRHPRQAGDAGNPETESDDSSPGFVRNEWGLVSTTSSSQLTHPITPHALVVKGIRHSCTSNMPPKRGGCLKDRAEYARWHRGLACAGGIHNKSYMRWCLWMDSTPNHAMDSNLQGHFMHSDMHTDVSASIQQEVVTSTISASQWYHP